jgi:hypothetical protein
MGISELSPPNIVRRLRPTIEELLLRQSLPLWTDNHYRPDKSHQPTHDTEAAMEASPILRSDCRDIGHSPRTSLPTSHLPA